MPGPWQSLFICACHLQREDHHHRRQSRTKGSRRTNGRAKRPAPLHHRGKYMTGPGMTTVPSSTVPGRYASPRAIAPVPGPQAAPSGGSLRTGSQNHAPAVINSPRQPLQAQPPGFVPVQSGFSLPAYGEPGHPIPEDFESTDEKSEPLFFEKKVSVFTMWQLFFIWMAVTGLVVFVASYIGFRRTLERYNPNTIFPPPTYAVNTPAAGELNGTCDEYMDCKGEAECLDGKCSCITPQFHVVAGACVLSSTSADNGAVDTTDSST